MKLAVAALLFAAGPCQALETLRLPWIFSDEPELVADFSFSPGREGRTRVELALGGRFSKFGLPRGAARAPILDIHCEVISPGDFVRQVATMEGRVGLQEVLDSYGIAFSSKAFSGKSPYVFKTEMSCELRPGDYNVVVELRDKELSIFSRRTLHLIVPKLGSESWKLSDLKFILAVGEELDKQGRPRRVLDPNPWRQCGGSSPWDLLLAYDSIGKAPDQKLFRKHSVSRLRGDGAEEWSEEGELPKKMPGQIWLARLEGEPLKRLRRGIYQFRIDVWAEGKKNRISGSKTFEVP